MFNVFEHPWTLLICAVFAFLVIGTLHSIFPEKQKRWHMLLVACFVGAAFGLDALVATDLEKIQTVVHTLRTGTENEDRVAIQSVIADTYRDSVHRTREQFIRRVNRELANPLVKKTAKIGLTVNMDSSVSATAILNMTIQFESESHVAKTYKPGFWTLLQIKLKKQANNQWLVNAIEILEIDKQSLSWGKIPPLS